MLSTYTRCAWRIGERQRSHQPEAPPCQALHKTPSSRCLPDGVGQWLQNWKLKTRMRFATRIPCPPQSPCCPTIAAGGPPCTKFTMASLVEREPAVVQALLDKLTAPSTSLAQKYRILFSLRGIAGEEAHAAMLEGACRRIMHAVRSLSHSCSTGERRVRCRPHL